MMFRSVFASVGGIILLLSLLGCTPVTQGSMVDGNLEPLKFNQLKIEDDQFISFDGAALGLSHWAASGEGAPEHVIIGVHGMNDYAGAFRWSAPYWSSQGVEVYAYDQRGFGRSPQKGIWSDEELLRKDLRAITSTVRAKHPDARITIIGVSMGAAVSITAFASDAPPDADQLILSGPGLRGWGALPLLYRPSLWLSAHLRPGWVVVPPRSVTRTITPTDNEDVLRVHWEDPHFLKENRIDMVFGLVRVMENAHKLAANLPEDVPTFLLYGGKDDIVPMRGVKRTTPQLPSHVKTAFYPDAYHMLLRDVDRQKVLDDILTFVRDPMADHPSGAKELPWR